MPCWRSAIDVADATGAGDAFTAGLLLALIEGLDLVTAARLGQQVAAAKLRAIGHSAMLPSWTTFAQQHMSRLKGEHSMTMGLALGMEELQAALPQPVLPQRPELVELYWAAWKLAARMVRHGTPENNFSPAYVDAAFGGNIFQWDTCFIAAFARYSRELMPVLPAFDNFYRLQDPDGYIAREYRWENGARLWAKRSGDSINPPLFAWAEWQVYRLTADRERLRTVWPHLDSYYRYLEQWHRNDDGTYWITDMGSGMDNTPRFAAGWIDMTCQQALNARMLSTHCRRAR